MAQLAPLLLGALAYAYRTRRLARRGRPVPRWRQACFYTGLAILAIALSPPLERIADHRLFWVHMVQHLLIGDLAALALVLGLTGPVLRPILALPSIMRLRFLLHPFVALPLWALTLWLWHLPALYQSALAHDAVHALEHMTFLVAGMLMWAAVVEPLPGVRWFTSGWKAAYILVVRLIAAALANVFIWSSHVFYPRYAAGERREGISALTDQRIAGAIMFIEGSVVTLVAFAVLFLRFMGEPDERQRRHVERPRSESAVR